MQLHFLFEILIHITFKHTIVKLSLLVGRSAVAFLKSFVGCEDVFADVGVGGEMLADFSVQAFATGVVHKSFTIGRIGNENAFLLKKGNF